MFSREAWGVIIICLLIVIYLRLARANKPSSEVNVLQSVKLSDVRGLAISAGGLYGYTLPGVFNTLQERGLDLGPNSKVDYFVGTSAGALASALLACRIPLNEIHESIINIDNKELLSDGGRSDLYKSCLGFGYMLSGDMLSETVRNTLNKHTVGYGIEDITFQQIYDLYGTTFIAVASELDIFAKPFYISRFNYPDMPIATAAHISATAPFVMAPVKLDGHILVDGAMVDPYPLAELQKYVPLENCLGIMLDYLTNNISWNLAGNCGLGPESTSVYVQGRGHPWEKLSEGERSRTIYVRCDVCSKMSMFSVSKQEKNIAYMDGVNSVSLLSM